MRCKNCGAGAGVQCPQCGGRKMCVPTDTIFERQRGQQCEATCLLCGHVPPPTDKPLPLVASRRITPAPIQGEINKAGGR